MDEKQLQEALKIEQEKNKALNEKLANKDVENASLTKTAEQLKKDNEDLLRLNGKLLLEQTKTPPKQKEDEVKSKSIDDIANEFYNKQ